MGGARERFRSRQDRDAAKRLGDEARETFNDNPAFLAAINKRRWDILNSLEKTSPSDFDAMCAAVAELRALRSLGTNLKQLEQNAAIARTEDEAIKAEEEKGQSPQEGCSVMATVTELGNSLTQRQAGHKLAAILGPQPGDGDNAPGADGAQDQQSIGEPADQQPHPEDGREDQERDFELEALGDDSPDGDPDTDTGEGDEPGESPAIEAPASWSDSDKDAFAELPEAVQQTIVAREADREKLLSQKSRELTEAQQRADAQTQAVEKAQEEARTHYANQLGPILQQLQTALSFEAQQVEAMLQNGDTDGYLVARQNLEARQRQYQMGVQQAQQIQAEQQQAQLKQFNDLVQKEQAKTDEVMGWTTPEERDKATRALFDYATKSLGFTAEEAGAVFDHRMFQTIDKARRWDELQAKAAEGRRKAAANKQGTKPPRRRAPASRPDPKAQERQQATQRLRSNPKDRHAQAAALKSFMET